MSHLVAFGYAVGALASWAIIAGMYFHGAQAIWLMADYPETRALAGRYYREHLGVSIVLGCFYAAIWPIGLPAAYLLSGFAEHGIWRQKTPLREDAVL